MSRKQLIIGNLILFAIIGFLYVLAAREIDSDSSFIPLGMVFILIGLANFLLFITYQRTRKLVATFYMMMAASFWVCSQVPF